jgi:hypothetical protein
MASDLCLAADGGSEGLGPGAMCAAAHTLSPTQIFARASPNFLSECEKFFLQLVEKVVQQRMATPAIPVGDLDDEGNPVWSSGLHGVVGQAGFVSNDARADAAVKMLREVVAEVTRGRIPVPQRKGPGFY